MFCATKPSATVKNELLRRQSFLSFSTACLTSSLSSSSAPARSGDKPSLVWRKECCLAVDDGRPKAEQIVVPDLPQRTPEAAGSCLSRRVAQWVPASPKSAAALFKSSPSPVSVAVCLSNVAHSANVFCDCCLLKDRLTVPREK